MLADALVQVGRVLADTTSASHSHLANHLLVPIPGIHATSTEVAQTGRGGWIFMLSVSGSQCTNLRGVFLQWKGGLRSRVPEPHDPIALPAP